jgi:predicted ATP-grasp superfamily ATP-dependent carboligase
MMPRVLLTGISTRAAAQSAARAGFAVTSIDAFADLDQHESVTALVLPGGFTARAAARAAKRIECDAVAYLSNFENHPTAVATLASGRALWGNPPAVLRRVRDPFLLASTLERRGFTVPAVRSREPATRNEEPGTRWLLKPIASGGGRRVRPWRSGARVPRGSYLQQLVDGTPGSIVFVAAAGRAVPLGMTRQLIGEHAFGTGGYQYCGNILIAGGDPHWMFDETMFENACALSQVVTEEFGLVGVNGIDFINDGARAVAIEVNPRWSASMELVERAYGLSVFAAHAAACAGGALPDFDLAAARRNARAFGKAVIFAKRDVVIGDTSDWARPVLPDQPGLPDLPDLEIADVPHPGERIAAGRPVCTVFAVAPDSASCHAALVRSAEHVYAELAAWEREVA